MGCVCGISDVELHGSKQDWEQMIKALDMLDEIAKIDEAKKVRLMSLEYLNINIFCTCLQVFVEGRGFVYVLLFESQIHI